jgi:FkbM family methyltransferase
MRVVEAGAHIGWVTIHLAELVGARGVVEVFEPSPANLPYLRRNIATIQQIRLHEVAVSDADGTATFYTEPISGQNDTLIENYHVFAENRARAFSQAQYRETLVRCVRLDSALTECAEGVDLMKIDVEGAESQVLRGAVRILASDRPALAVEITRERAGVVSTVERAGYRAFSEELRAVDPMAWPERNLVFLHVDRHADLIRTLESPHP